MLTFELVCRYRAKKPYLSLPEFAHCLLSVATALLDVPAVAEKLSARTTEGALRTLMERFIMPRYVEEDGRGVGDDIDQTASRIRDEELPELEEKFREQLEALFVDAECHCMLHGS